MSSYLVQPEALPERSGAAPWGSECLCLRVGGRELEIEGLSRRQKETLAGLWSDFSTDAASPSAASVSVLRVDRGLFRSFDRRGWSYSLDFDYQRGSTRLIGMDLIAQIDWTRKISSALWTAAGEPDEFHGAFENFLRVLLAHVTLLGGDCLVHSSAVLGSEGARLFVGPSGAGKSTVARLALATGRSVLSDDLNLIVRRNDGRWTVAGSPFLGDVGERRDGDYSLLGIYRLEKGPRDSLRPMTRAEAVATLLACAPFVNHSPHLRDALLGNLAAVTGSVPGYVLTFRREGTFWPLLDPC